MTEVSENVGADFGMARPQVSVEDALDIVFDAASAGESPIISSEDSELGLSSSEEEELDQELVRDGNVIDETFDGADGPETAAALARYDSRDDVTDSTSEESSSTDDDRPA